VAPLLVVGLAAGLWYLSDRLLYVGPLDRATFGWLVVIPLWALAPIAAGFAWRGIAPRARIIAAVACAFVVGGVLAALLWFSVAFPACQFGAVRSPLEQVLPSIVVGSLVAGGFGFSTLVASGEVQAGRSARALVLGAVGQLVVVAVAPVLVSLLFFGGCQRP
jgi:hypothetical protein